MIIDIASHIVTWEVEEALAKKKDFKLIRKNFTEDNSNPEHRIALMEKYGIDMQVLTQTTPVLQGLEADEADEICRMSNDAIGRIARQYPDRFIPFSVVSLLKVDAAILGPSGNPDVDKLRIFVFMDGYREIGPYLGKPFSIGKEV